ncbi:MAG: C4-dicarboxylate ABC transporter, partial [Nitrososphaerales archaeon]
MATGIVARALTQEGLPSVGTVLLWVTILSAAALTALYLARMALYPDHVLADFRDFSKAPGFFTIVVGLDVLASDLASQFRADGPASALWIAAVVLGAILMYALVSQLTLAEGKPPVERALNGSWLLLAVATESISVAGIAVAPTLIGELPWLTLHELLFFALGTYLLGGMLYLIVITLIFYRLVFLPMAPRD